MSRGRHHRLPLLWAYRHHVADAALGLLAVSFIGGTISTARDVAPHAHAPVTVAAPTAVDLREPTGHGGPIGPVAGPSFAPDMPVWTEEKGPVIVNGQALARPTVAAQTEAPPRPETSARNSPVALGGAEADPTATASSEPAAEPTPPPVVVVPEPTEPTDEPEVTEPVETPVETTPPTEPPAEPTVPVVEVGS